MTPEWPDERRRERARLGLEAAELSRPEDEPASADVLFEPTPEFRADPYPVYAHLRAQDPVHRTALGLWVLTRYEDVAIALRDARFSREGFEAVFAVVDGTPAASSTIAHYRGCVRA